MVRLAFRFQMEGVAGSELQAVTKGLGQNDAARFIEGKLDGHDGIMEWEKPIVNGILKKKRGRVAANDASRQNALGCKIRDERGAQHTGTE